MTYINIFDENKNSIPYGDILEKIAAIDDDIMLIGEQMSQYSSEGLDLGDLTRLLSLTCSKGIYLSHLDINPNFDYVQLLDSPCFNTPVLLDCISLSKERLKKENICFYESVFQKLKEKDYGGGLLIANLIGGFPDESLTEYEENCMNLRKYGFRNVCISPLMSDRFSIVNFYSFREFLEKDLKGPVFYNIN